MPIRNNSLNTYLEYHSLNRHWSPESQRYAGGDHLMVVLDQGWKIAGYIPCDLFWFRALCCTRLYKVTLHRGEDVMYMTVLSSPHVDRLVDRVNHAIRRHKAGEGRPLEREVVPGRRWA